MRDTAAQDAMPPPPKPHPEKRRAKRKQAATADTQIALGDNFRTPGGNMVAATPDTSVNIQAPTPAAAFYTVRAMAAEDSSDKICQLEMHFCRLPATCGRTRHCPLTQTRRTNLGTSHCAKTLVSGCLANIVHSSNVCGLEHPMQSCTSILLLRAHTNFIGVQT